MSGKVWYVCNASGANGADAASPAGQQRVRPLLTTAQAITNASAGDTIQYLAGHDETTAVTIAASKAGLHFISEGTTATRAILRTASAVPIMTISAAGVWTENISFVITHASANCILTSGAISGVQHIDCSFSAAVASPALVSWASAVTGGRFSGCTWTSAATSTANAPAVGLLIGAVCVDTEMDTCTFSGGASETSYFGWTNYALRATSALTRFTAIDTDLLLDSDMQLATGSIYKIHVRNASGSSWVELTA
jgi:hypothetical protein